MTVFWIDAVITVAGLTLFYWWLHHEPKKMREYKKQHPEWYK